MLLCLLISKLIAREAAAKDMTKQGILSIIINQTFIIYLRICENINRNVVLEYYMVFRVNQYEKTEVI